MVNKMVCQVVNIKYDDYDVYIGRGSKWGNPFSHNKKSKAKWIVSTREEAIECYKEYILSNEQLMYNLYELKDKTIGCHCKPKMCHGDILVDLVNNLK